MRYETNHPYYQDDFLNHEGVKGMKWGVWNEETRARRLRERRRASKTGNSSIGSNNNLITKIKDRFVKKNEEPHLKRTHLTKELANISDEELNAAIRRMQLEQNYLNLLKAYPDASDKGKKYANQFSDELFKNLSNGLGGAMGRKIAKAIDEWMEKDSSRDNDLRREAESKTTKTLQDENTRYAAIDKNVEYKKKYN